MKNIRHIINRLSHIYIYSIFIAKGDWPLPFLVLSSGLIFFLDTFLWNFHLVSLKSFSQRNTLKGTLMFANYSLIFTINIDSSLLDLLKNLFYFVRNILCYKCKKSIYYDNNNMQTHRRQSEKSVIVKN